MRLFEEDEDLDEEAPREDLGEPCEEEFLDTTEKSTEEESHTAEPEKTESEYLDMARRIQADFDNFRRHAEENTKRARVDGQASVIEVFLPCLDTFKEAKKTITDDKVLKGVEMIEGKINEALTRLGVEKIESIGLPYDPHKHESIAVMRNDEVDNDIILEEYQAGYKFNDKVLRYAKVIVNKKD